MPEDTQQRATLDSAISGDRGSNLARDLKHHDSRMAIKDVVTEHIASSVFADRVKAIQLELLESTETYKKIDDKVQNQINTTLSDRGLKNRNFIIPTVIASISALGTVAAVVVAIIALSAPKQ